MHRGRKRKWLLIRESLIASSMISCSVFKVLALTRTSTGSKSMLSMSTVLNLLRISTNTSRLMEQRIPSSGWPLEIGTSLRRTSFLSWYSTSRTRNYHSWQPWLWLTWQHLPLKTAKTRRHWLMIWGCTKTWWSETTSLRLSWSILQIACRRSKEMRSMNRWSSLSSYCSNSLYAFLMPLLSSPLILIFRLCKSVYCFILQKLLC